LDGNHQLDAKHQEITNEQNRGDRRIAPNDAAEFFADGGEGEIEVGAAFVAAGGVDTDESAAHRTDAWAGLLLAASKKSTEFGFPAIQSRLPTIGKRQRSSLRRLRSGTYNTGIAPMICLRDAKGGEHKYGQI
jgi:hypothetical protein